MPDEPPATRRELAELRRNFNERMRRVEQSLQKHERQHAEDARARVVGRRWLVGVMISLGAVIEVPLLYLVAHLH